MSDSYDQYGQEITPTDAGDYLHVKEDLVIASEEGTWTLSKGEIISAFDIAQNFQNTFGSFPTETGTIFTS